MKYLIGYLVKTGDIGEVYTVDHLTRGEWGKHIIAFHHTALQQMLLERSDLH